MGLLNSESIVQMVDAAKRNHQVIANNIANVNTPGFQTRRLRFIGELDKLLDGKGRLRGGSEAETEIYKPMFSTTSPDGNDVVLEREMVEMNKNTLRAKTYMAMLAGRIKRMRSAISGRSS